MRLRLTKYQTKILKVKNTYIYFFIYLVLLFNLNEFLNSIKTVLFLGWHITE